MNKPGSHPSAFDLALLRRIIAKAAACVAVSFAAFSFAGCSAPDPEPDFSNVREVAELTTYECYYHNVVMMDHEKSGFLFGIGDIGYKKAWYEYSGIVRVGLDVSKVSVSGPNAADVVTVTIPKAQVLGLPDVDEDSFTDGLTERGWFTSDFTPDEKNRAFSQAQEAMKEKAEADEDLMFQAQQRAKDILGRYVENTGEALGETYTVEWVELDEDGAAAEEAPPEES